MSDYNFKNNLKSTLQSKLWSDATSIYCNHVVESEDADTRRNVWPAFPFTLTIVDTANDNIEIVKCTSLASNSSDAIVFHCDRAQESTTAQTFEIATTNIEHRLTAAALNAITSNIDEVTTNVSESLAQHLGSIISVLATDTYVPVGCVPCNGTEYTRAQFPTLYDSYLIGTTPKLLTCTYTEWSTQVGLTGNCAKFAVDTTNQTFKVPMLKDGDSITQATTSTELGKSYKAGLPNATGQFTDAQFVAPYNASGVFQIGSPTGSVTAPSSGGTQATVVTTLSLQRSNAIYGNSTTVTDEQVRLRHFVVLASAQNNASVFDWSNYMAGLAGKANLDMNNLTQSGTTSIAHNAMPSTRTVNVSVPASMGTFEAIGDGFLTFAGAATAQGGILQINAGGVTFQSPLALSSGNALVCSAPVSKNSTVTVYYTAVNTLSITFRYANGAH